VAHIRANGFFSKILHCLRTEPSVFNAAYSWIELSDFIPAELTGTLTPDKFIAACALRAIRQCGTPIGMGIRRGIFCHSDPKLGALRSHLPVRVHSIDRAVDGLTGEWAKKTGLKAGIPVAVGAFDAHLGAIGSGISPGCARENHRHEHMRHRDCPQ